MKCCTRPFLSPRKVQITPRSPYIVPTPCFFTFPLLPNYSSSISYSGNALRVVKDYIYRTWAPGVRFGHQTLRKQRWNMQPLVVIPGAAPGLSWAASGLLLGCLGSLRALWLLLAAPWPILGLSWSEFAGTKATRKNEVRNGQFDPPISSHSEFSWIPGLFGEQERYHESALTEFGSILTAGSCPRAQTLENHEK